MAMANPRSLIWALHKYWDVVEHLVRLARETLDFDRDQIRAVVCQHLSDTDSNAQQIVLQNLVSSEVLHTLPRSDTLMINQLVTEFVRGLTKEHELGLSSVLRARVDAIKEATAALAEALNKGDRDQRRQSSGQLAELFRQIAQQLEQDQDAILKLAEESKSLPDNMPLQRRYKRVLNAYDKYVQPMIEMMDTSIDGVFYRHLEQAERVLDQAVERLMIEGALYNQQRSMRQVSYQAKALRSQGREVLTRCSDILLPLREEVRRHSSLSSSINLMLGEVRKRGLHSVFKDQQLPYWQRDRKSRIGLGNEVLTIMAEAMDFEPQHIPFPEESSSSISTIVEPVNAKAIRSHLVQSQPVDDVLRWLHQHYGHYSDATLLRLYNSLVYGEDWSMVPVSDETELNLKEVRVNYYPHGCTITGSETPLGESNYE